MNPSEYSPKVADMKIESVNNVYLTPRQTEACLFTARGKTTKVVAMLMGIETETAKRHIGDSMERLTAANRAHLVAKAVGLGILRITFCFFALALAHNTFVRDKFDHVQNLYGDGERHIYPSWCRSNDYHLLSVTRGRHN